MMTVDQGANCLDHFDEKCMSVDDGFRSDGQADHMSTQENSVVVEVNPQQIEKKKINMSKPPLKTK